MATCGCGGFEAAGGPLLWVRRNQDPRPLNAKTVTLNTKPSTLPATLPVLAIVNLTLHRLTIIFLFFRV